MHKMGPAKVELQEITKAQTLMKCLLVHKTEKLEGTIFAPPSKSYTHRAVVIGSMNGRSTIINPLFSEDTIATINALKKLGITTRKDEDTLMICGFEAAPILPSEIDVGESGTLLRFLLSIVALGRGKITISGQGTLLQRSNNMAVEPLKQLGVKIEAADTSYRLPITVYGQGGIRGGCINVRGDKSSQIVSSLLVSAPFANENVKIVVEGKIVSKPYIDITIDVLQKAGINVDRDDYRTFKIDHGQIFKPLHNYVIHGDYSSAAFLMGAACLVQSNVVIKDLVSDKQGDQKIIDILREMGANITRDNDSVHIEGPFELRGIKINCCDTPDLVPAIASVAAFAKGETEIYDIGHIKYKESDRIDSLTQELGKLGVEIQSTKDKIIIKESSPIPGEVFSHHDHRIAMALALVGLRTGGLLIKDTSCIAKSYRNFVKDMRDLGASILEK